MIRSHILGTGHYLPSKVVTNADLAKLMDTSDEWIQQRTGIVTRHYVDFEKEPMGASDLGTRAGQAALADAGLKPADVDLIIYATLSPDRTFPGDGVLVQAKLDVPAGVPALDIRNQCSGFLYGLQIADSFVRLGVYRHVLLIGAEVHSTGLDFTDRGRDVTVLFGDGAAAVVVGPAKTEDTGILAVRVHADGRFADELTVPYPSSAEMPRVTPEKVQAGAHFPQMNGKTVFKHAVNRMPEVVLSVLAEASLSASDISLLIPHQANLRISELVQRRLQLSDAQVFNNIMRYGNTTAASIPLALDEARRQGRVHDRDIVCLAAFGAGFTWGAAVLRW